jgi:hypothetical protein
MRGAYILAVAQLEELFCGGIVENEGENITTRTTDDRGKWYTVEWRAKDGSLRAIYQATAS